MRRLAHAFVAMALAAMPTTGMAAEATPPPSADHTDGEKVTIYFGPDRYAIPRIDLGSGYRAPPGAPEHTKALVFMFLLPDMRPAALDPAEANRTGWHNQVSVLFEHGINFKSAKAIAIDAMTRAKMPPINHEPESEKCDTYRGEFITSSELHLCNNKGRFFVVECSGAFPFEIYPACTIHENVTENASAIIHFAKKHVDRSTDIERFLFEYLPSHKR